MMIVSGYEPTTSTFPLTTSTRISTRLRAQQGHPHAVQAAADGELQGTSYVSPPPVATFVFTLQPHFCARRHSRTADFHAARDQQFSARRASPRSRTGDGTPAHRKIRSRRDEEARQVVGKQPVPVQQRRRVLGIARRRLRVYP